MLPELAAVSKKVEKALNKEYSSKDSLLDIKGTKKLLDDYGIVESSLKAEESELLV
jgi:hypothetical protein